MFSFLLKEILNQVSEHFAAAFITVALLLLNFMT